MYTLEKVDEEPIVLVRLEDRIDTNMISHMFMESVGHFQTMEGAACLVIDFENVVLLDPQRFANALRVFQRTTPTFKRDAPLFYAFVGINDCVTSLRDILEGMKFHVPVFTSTAEAISYLSLKVGGTYLRETKVRANTNKLDTLYIAGHSHHDEVAEVMLPMGTQTFPKGGILRIQDNESGRVMLILPRGSMVIGRQDSSADKPDVDLSMWGAFHKGMSRCHSLLRLTENQLLQLLDMGSSNGTKINGQRIEPNTPYVIHDGDEIVFGVLAVRVFYQDTMDTEFYGR